MSLMDELRRLARPYEDEEEYEEDFDLEEPFVETKEERKPRGKKREEDDMERDYADTSRDKVVNINTTTQLQVVPVKPEKFPSYGGLPVRRCLCPGRQDQESGCGDLHHHALQCGHHRRPDRRTGKQRDVLLIVH